MFRVCEWVAVLVCKWTGEREGVCVAGDTAHHPHPLLFYAV